jgi:hypothetical protein
MGTLFPFLSVATGSRRRDFVPILGQEKGLKVSSKERDMKLYEREETVEILGLCTL